MFPCLVKLLFIFSSLNSTPFPLFPDTHSENKKQEVQNENQFWVLKHWTRSPYFSQIKWIKFLTLPVSAPHYLINVSPLKSNQEMEVQSRNDVAADALPYSFFEGQKKPSFISLLSGKFNESDGTLLSQPPLKQIEEKPECIEIVKEAVAPSYVCYIQSPPPPTKIFIPPPPLPPTRAFIIPSFHYQEGKGRSYRKGFESVGLFIGLDSSFVNPFIDFRAALVENKFYATNFGIGLRLRRHCDEWLGCNLYYDRRETRAGTFEQIGIGGELFFRNWEIRVNGYIPVGPKQFIAGTKVYEYPGGFVAQSFFMRNAMWGLNAEFGRTVRLSKGLFLYSGIGPYYYSRNITTTAGGLARVVLYLNQFLSCGFQYTYDDMFHSRFQALATLTVPFSSICGCFCVRPVYRNEMIIISRCCNWKTNF